MFCTLPIGPNLYRQGQDFTGQDFTWMLVRNEDKAFVFIS